MKVIRYFFLLFCGLTHAQLLTENNLVTLSTDIISMIQKAQELTHYAPLPPAVRVLEYAYRNGIEHIDGGLVWYGLVQLHDYLDEHHRSPDDLGEYNAGLLHMTLRSLATRSKTKIIDNLLVSKSIRANNVMVAGSIHGTIAGACISALTGQTGITGQTGLSGSVGSALQSGATGFTGATGSTGASGLNGNAGSQGARGPFGGTGNTGPTGFTGFTGFTGLRGAFGQQGPTGQTGPAGGTDAFAYIYSIVQSVVPFAAAIPLEVQGLVVNMAVTSDSIIFLSDGIYEITYQVNGFKTGSTSSNEIQIRVVNSSNALFNAATYGKGTSSTASSQSRPLNGQFIAVVTAGDSVRLINNTGTVTNTLTLQHSPEFPNSVTANLLVKKLL